jgi:hypothetical protein
MIRHFAQGVPLLYMSDYPTLRRCKAYPAALTVAVLHDMIANSYGVVGQSSYPAGLDPRRE